MWQKVEVGLIILLQTQRIEVMFRDVCDLSSDPEAEQLWDGQVRGIMQL